MNTRVEEEVRIERARQNNLWGEQNHEPLYWLGVVNEETGEVAKGLIEHDPEQARAEWIHVAAVAIAAAESYDRNVVRDAKG